MSSTVFLNTIAVLALLAWTAIGVTVYRMVQSHQRSNERVEHGHARHASGSNEAAES